MNVGVVLTHRCQAALAARQACRVSRSYLKKKCVGVQWMGCGSFGPPLFLHSLSGIIWSVSSQTRGLLCPPLCFSQLVGSCIVSSRGISAPRHAESLHRDRFGQKERYRVGPAFSGCVMGFSCSTFMISGTW